MAVQCTSVDFSHSHHGFTELLTVEWLQILLVWALKTLNKFEIVSHFRREALEKEKNFLFPGFLFFFISLLMMCYNFSSNLNQGASVILREYSLPILGRATDMEMQTMCKNFILQFRMKLLYLEWISLKKNRWTVSATQFLCNQNTGFILWSLCNQNLNFYSCTSQEVDESLGYYLNNKKWAWNKLSTEDWGESMLSSLVVLRNSSVIFSTVSSKFKVNCHLRLSILSYKE